MSSIWFAIFDLAFSTLFVIAVCTVIDRFKGGGDGGTALKVKNWFRRGFGNTTEEAKLFLPREVHYSAIELGWTRRKDLEVGDCYIWERPDGILYHSDKEVPTIVVFPRSMLDEAMYA
jgi:hypothetical protein